MLNCVRNLTGLAKAKIMKTFMKVLSFMLSVFLAAGCVTPVYKEVFSDKSSCNSRQFPVDKDALYRATLRTICARNFIIEKESQGDGFILAKRPFQRGKRTYILVLQASVSPDGKEKTTLYLNALQTAERYYVADHTRFFLWIVPLPGGGGKEGTTIKEGEKIIEDKAFYQNFFVEIEEEIRNLAPAASVQEARAVDENKIKEEQPVKERVTEKENAVESR